MELHQITLSWPGEIQQDAIQEEFPRISKSFQKILEKPDALEASLDDMFPDEFLSSLEKGVRTFQRRMIAQLLKKNVHLSVITQAAVQLGQCSAARRWPTLVSTSSDLRKAVLALEATALSGRPHFRGILIKRALANEVRFDLLSCPRRSHATSDEAIDSSLCSIYNHWIKGFVTAFHPSILIESEANAQGCTHFWRRE